MPSAVLLARQQRPEPVPSVFPKTLSDWHSRFYFAPPAKPAGAWRVKLDAQMARLEQAQKGLLATFERALPVTTADRESIQAEVENACTQAVTPRWEHVMRIAPPLEPPADTSESWPEPPNMRVMP